ncbi:penicillin-binding protein 2, partial [candidate division KSB1 bacterium]|nr:penicillin-binding protein 2 [candidate division KSB1 bacterium]
MQLVRILMTVLFSVLALRFFQIQIIQKNTYRYRSNQNHIRQISLRAARGILYDREGCVLADNQPSYSLYIIPHIFDKNKMDQEIIASTIQLSVDSIEQMIRLSNTGPFTPVRLMRDIDFNLLSRIQENQLDLPSLVIEQEPVRRYPQGNVAVHTLGFTGEISSKELDARQKEEYRRGDLTGKSGVEKIYDPDLRGQKGFRYIEVDVRGREVGDLGGRMDQPPQVGRSLRLTIDLDLQNTLQEVFPEARGAAVALDPNNGEVLAMISRPGLDLMRFASTTNLSFWQDILTDTTHPMMNRAIQSQLPPGSTYKIVSALAALSDPSFNPQDTIICHGAYYLGRKRFACWNPGGHGAVNFIEAIRKSCNVYFYQMAFRINWDGWFKQARQLGFGQRTGIDLYGEMTGLLPDLAYHQDKYHRNNLGKGSKLNLVIGQGDLLVTPIQMGVLGAVIASDGNLIQPHVVQAIQDGEGNWRSLPVGSQKVDVSKKSISLIKRGMRLAAEPGGTAVRAAVPGLSVCGKTGTAQNPHGKSHAWFLGFAPADNPKLVIVVVLEQAGGGGAMAAPIAHHLFSNFLKANP